MLATLEYAMPEEQIGDFSAEQVPSDEQVDRQLEISTGLIEHLTPEELDKLPIIVGKIDGPREPGNEAFHT